MPRLPVLLLSLCAAAALSAPRLGASVRPDHPLLGLWQLPFPGNACVEIYRIEANGTTLVTSGREVTESQFTLSDQPSAKGFYLWVDQLVKVNGQPDCAGDVALTGATSTHQVRVHPSGRMFVLCDDEEERLDRCLGPFVRLLEGDV